MGYTKQKKEDDDALITIRLGGLSILGVVFVILKVYGVIDWSWWWVCSPFIVDILF